MERFLYATKNLPYNEVSVYMTFMLFIPNEAVMESFYLQKLSLTGCI